MKLNLAIALTLATVCAGTAFGDTINFNNPTGTLGNSQTYGIVTAYGFSGTTVGTATKLYGKNDGGSENGVGIANQPDHEITNTTFIQLDLINITGLYSLSIGSTQGDEGFNVCQSNAFTVLGSCKTYNFSNGSDPFTTGEFSTLNGRYVSIQADGTPTAAGNVLLDSLTYGSNPVPEPSSLLLLGTGIIAAAGIARRKLSA